jgi:hypothetical protein
VSEGLLTSMDLPTAKVAASASVTTSGGTTYLAVCDDHSYNASWVQLRTLVNDLATTGCKVYLVLPSLPDGLHRNIFPVVLGSQTAGWMGLQQMWWTWRAARVARRLAARLGRVEHLEFDPRNQTWSKRTHPGRPRATPIPVTAASDPRIREISEPRSALTPSTR